MYDDETSNTAVTTTDEAISAGQKAPEAKRPRSRRKKTPASPSKSLLVIRQGAKELLTISFTQDDSSGLSFEFKNCEGERHDRGQ